mmetsp:Transcript_3041/g.9292  ORF Transcript_3041/g.9292 Transcript_3041/m.9292 type:complete len:321 (-) Transcript_3041:1024-1986(-)
MAASAALCLSLPSLFLNAPPPPLLPGAMSAAPTTAARPRRSVLAPVFLPPGPNRTVEFICRWSSRSVPTWSNEYHGPARLLRAAATAADAARGANASDSERISCAPSSAEPSDSFAARSTKRGNSRVSSRSSLLRYSSQPLKSASFVARTRLLPVRSSCRLDDRRVGRRSSAEAATDRRRFLRGSVRSSANAFRRRLHGARCRATDRMSATRLTMATEDVVVHMGPTSAAKIRSFEMTAFLAAARLTIPLHCGSAGGGWAISSNRRVCGQTRNDTSLGLVGLTCRASTVSASSVLAAGKFWPRSPVSVKSSSDARRNSSP